jgi:tRNA 2-thiouridine synthesizing protein A
VKKIKEISISKFLNLRGEICPFNYVKTKLALEEMEKGEVLEVVVDHPEAIENVPRSCKEEGHVILLVERIEGAYRLLIEKGRE